MLTPPISQRDIDEKTVFLDRDGGHVVITTYDKVDEVDNCPWVTQDGDCYSSSGDRYRNCDPPLVARLGGKAGPVSGKLNFTNELAATYEEYEKVNGDDIGVDQLFSPVGDLASVYMKCSSGGMLKVYGNQICVLSSSNLGKTCVLRHDLQLTITLSRVR